jgi:AAA15 family ATPase/GTPase
MEFVQFSIKNFKGINDLKIKIDNIRNIYTFVGLNESGKTTILEAINAFANPLPKEERHTLINKKEKYSFKGTIELSAILKLTPKDKEEITKYLRTKGYRVNTVGDNVELERKYKFLNSKFVDGVYNFWGITLKVRKLNGRIEKNLIEDNKAIWIETVTFIEANLFPKVIYYPNFLFDFPERIYLEPIKGETVEFTKYRDIVQDILSSINPILNLDTDILSRLKEPNDRENELLDHLLDKMSSVVSETVFNAWGKLFKRSDKKIEIKYGKEMADNKVYHYLQFKLKEKNSLFSISERSLGFKWFFSFLLFTEFRKNRTSDKSRVLFLLDEPASNLHPTAQQNLLKTFEDLVDKSILFYTTHSHYLINPGWLNGTFIVKNNSLLLDEDLLDVIDVNIEVTAYKKFVANHPNQKEYFQPILDCLDYQPGLLEKIPSITMVEGKNDYYTFKYILSIYFHNQFDLHFYPSGGATSDEDIIRLYESWNRNYIVLKDADSAGKKAIEKYINIFPFIRDRAYTIEDILPDEKGSSLEDIFSDSEKLRITIIGNENAITYKKENFNLGIQFLLFEKKKIELSDLSLQKFKAIFGFLETSFKKMDMKSKIGSIVLGQSV